MLSNCMHRLRKKGFYLDPRTKILYMVFITSMMFFVYAKIAIDVAIVVISVCLLITNKNYKTALLYSVLFAAAVVASATKDMMALPMLLNMVSVLLNALIIRLFPILMLGYYVVSSTKASEFISAMVKWHVPEAFIIPVSVVFRFLPTLKEENQCISNAMKMRGINWSGKKTRSNPGLFLEFRMIPLFFSVVKIGDELSASALTRGLDDVKNRSSLVETQFTKYDLLMLIISVGLFVWAVW